jgi:hypothetical protein
LNPARIAAAVYFDDIELIGDGDGVPDFTDNCVTVVNPGQADTDLNGVGNLCEIGVKQTFNDGATPVLGDGVS